MPLIHTMESTVDSKHNNGLIAKILKTTHHGSRPFLQFKEKGLVVALSEYLLYSLFLTSSDTAYMSG